MDTQDKSYSSIQSKAVNLLGFLGIISTLLFNFARNYINIIFSQNIDIFFIKISTLLIIGLISITIILLLITIGLTTFHYPQLSTDLQQRMEWEPSENVTSIILSTQVEIWEKNDLALSRLPFFFNTSLLFFAASIVAIFTLLIYILSNDLRFIWTFLSIILILGIIALVYRYKLK